MKTIGVISDTHGLLRPEALRALQGVELILHAGDVGNPEILDKLRKIAPTTAIRGNVDKAAWALALPETEFITVEEVNIYMLHDLQQLEIDLAIAGVGVVIFGHTHEPVIGERKGVLYLNPGSAGPRRFSLPVSLAKLIVNGASAKAELIQLQV